MCTVSYNLMTHLSNWVIALKNEREREREKSLECIYKVMNFPERQMKEMLPPQSIQSDCFAGNSNSLDV